MERGDFVAAFEEGFGVVDHPDRATVAGEATGEEFPCFTLRDLQPCLESRWLIKGLIPAGGFGVAYAEPQCGKTAIIVDMAFHVDTGREYRGRRVERQPVIYVALEGHGGIGNRIIAAARELGVDDGASFTLVLVSANFRDPASSAKVAKTAKRLGGCPLIVIDTLTAALHGGSDCNPEDVGALIEATKAELMAQGCTVLLVHHCGKDASKGARGWSGLLAACDFEFELSRDGETRFLNVSKMRDGSDNQPAFCYQLHGLELGLDQYDDPVTAVVVEHLADGATATVGKRYSPKARTALNVLWACIKDPSRSWPLPDQPGRKCTLIEVWEKACIQPGIISKAHEEKERRRKFRAAMDELKEAGAVITDSTNDQRVYPAPKS